MSNRSWEESSTYACLRAVRPPRFAWEFLRRNREFCSHRAGLRRLRRSGTLHQADLDGFASRWGLHFRKTRRKCRGVGAGLDPFGASDHRYPDDDVAVTDQRGFQRSGQTGGLSLGVPFGRLRHAENKRRRTSRCVSYLTALRPTVRGPRRLGAAPLAPGYRTSAWTRSQRFIA